MVYVPAVVDVRVERNLKIGKQIFGAKPMNRAEQGAGAPVVLKQI
jgi:hypothetical protein